MTLTRVFCLAVVPAVLLLTACGSAVDPVAVPGGTAPATVPSSGTGTPPGSGSDDTGAAEPTGDPDAGPTAEPSVTTSTGEPDRTGSGPTTELDPTGEPDPTSPMDPAPGGPVTAEDIAAAATGLDGWLADHRPATPSTSTDIPGCPGLDLDVLQAALDDRGWTDPIVDWSTEIEWDEYEDLDEDLMGIACGGDSDGDVNDSGTSGTAAGLAAAGIGSIGWPEFLREVGLDGLPATSINSLPGDAVAGCEDSMCIAAWHADGLVVAVMVDGPADLDADGITDLFDELGPTVLATLATA